MRVILYLLRFISIVFRHLIRELRGGKEGVEYKRKEEDWTDPKSKLWQQIKEKPSVPFNLNVLLEGMSLKNSRTKLIEQIEEHKPTINPEKTLYTLRKYLSLFKDQLESTEKNVLNSVGRLPINEDQIQKKKLPKTKELALKREISRNKFELSKTETQEKIQNILKTEELVNETKDKYNNRLQQIIKQARLKGNQTVKDLLKPYNFSAKPPIHKKNVKSSKMYPTMASTHDNYQSRNNADSNLFN